MGLLVEGQEEAFDVSAGGSPGKEAGGNDLGLVDDQAIAGGEVIEQVGEVAMFDAAGWAVSIEHEQTRGGAVG